MNFRFTKIGNHAIANIPKRYVDIAAAAAVAAATESGLSHELFNCYGMVIKQIVHRSMAK